MLMAAADEFLEHGVWRALRPLWHNVAIHLCRGDSATHFGIRCHGCDAIPIKGAPIPTPRDAKRGSSKGRVGTNLLSGRHALPQRFVAGTYRPVPGVLPTPRLLDRYHVGAGAPHAPHMHTHVESGRKRERNLMASAPILVTVAGFTGRWMCRSRLGTTTRRATFASRRPLSEVMPSSEPRSNAYTAFWALSKAGSEAVRCWAPMGCLTNSAPLR